MSFWQDDFYSTRPSSKTNRNRRFVRSYREKAAGALIVSLLGVCIVLAVMLVVVSSVRLTQAEEAVPASAAMSGADLAELKKDYNELVIRAAEMVNPSVVSVIGLAEEGRGGQRTKERAEAGSGADPGSGYGTGESSVVGLGSGVIFQKIDGKARIVTNNHVIDRVGSIQVVLTNGEKKKAKLIGKDKFTDLAVLEVDDSGIEAVAEFGDSDQLKAGEAAIAIGNPLGLGFSQTITVGVISSPRRTIPISLGQDGNIDWEMDVIQTDAAINQGNSGGALVNLDGKVVGINSMKVADMGVEGLGFAIPINEAKPIIESLIRDGKVKRPYMGVYTQDLQTYFEGNKVLKLPKQVKTGIIVLDATGPAKEAGLRTNDVIVALDGQEIDSTLALRKYLYANKEIGDELEVTFYRNGKKKEVMLELGELAEDK
jgi:serine protease Do